MSHEALTLVSAELYTQVPLGCLGAAWVVWTVRSGARHVMQLPCCPMPVRLVSRRGWLPLQLPCCHQPERLSAGEACHQLLLVVCDVPLGMLHAASRAVDPGYSVSTLNEARSRAKEARIRAVGCAVLRCTVLRPDEHATTRLCR